MSFKAFWSHDYTRQAEPGPCWGQPLGGWPVGQEQPHSQLLFWPTTAPSLTSLPPNFPTSTTDSGALRLPRVGEVKLKEKEKEENASVAHNWEEEK